MEKYTLTVLIRTYEGKGNVIITEKYETHAQCRDRVEDLCSILNWQRVYSVGYQVEKTSTVGSDEFKEKPSTH